MFFPRFLHFTSFFLTYCRLELVQGSPFLLSTDHRNFTCWWTESIWGHMLDLQHKNICKAGQWGHVFILWDDLLGTDLQNAIYSHYDNPGQSIFLQTASTHRFCTDTFHFWWVFIKTTPWWSRTSIVFSHDTSMLPSCWSNLTPENTFCWTPLWPGKLNRVSTSWQIYHSYSTRL